MVSEKTSRLLTWCGSRSECEDRYAAASGEMQVADMCVPVAERTSLVWSGKWT